MPTSANSMNVSSAGLVKFDGTKVFSGVTTTQYNTLVGDTSNSIANISPGTSGQVLTSNGASANPSYQSPPSAKGNWVSLGTQSPTGATAAFNSWTTGYLYYVVQFIEVIPTTNATRLELALSTDGGSTYTNVTWDNGGFDAPSSGGGGFVSNAGVSATPDILLGAVQSNTSDEGVNGWLYLWGLDSSTYRKTLHQYITHPISSTAMDFRNIGYHVRLTTQVTGLRFIYSGAGGFASGTLNFYGVQS